MYKKKNLLLISMMLVLGCSPSKRAATMHELPAQQKNTSFKPAQQWYDDAGEPINAHGGGILYNKGKYYWFGEKRGQSASEGVNVYSSSDLYNWKFENLALSPDESNAESEIAKGCLMERPKVIFNAKSGKYVMWFHLELKGKGYSAARAAVAVSDNITGPYKFINSFRPNGHMSRDMTLFVDDDGSAYHVYSSRDNYDLRLTKLTEDYLEPSQEDTLMFSNGREAPAMFKYMNRYFLITSGCSGWAPNKASLHSSKSIWGPWKLYPENPLKGPNADSSFGGQSAYILPVPNKTGAFIFMADKWNPENLKDSRHIWLPIQFKNGNPIIDWMDDWGMSFYK